MRGFLTCIPLILFLAACSGGAGSAPPRYEPPAKPGGRLCAFQCRTAFEKGTEACGLQERVCMNQMQAQAIKDYEAYTTAQFKLRAPVELRPRDFENMELCTATACRTQSETSYNACFENCGGKIVK